MPNFPQVSGVLLERQAPAVAKPRSTAVAIGERLSLVEAGRGVAACCIVAHHLSAYGDMPDIAAQAAPGLMSFFYDYARMAVHAFLVFGGFSLGWMVGEKPLTWRAAGDLFLWRYLRLAVPYLAMLAMLLAVAWITRASRISPPLIDSFSWPQLLAHGFFLQDVLGYGNFSAGTWYLCIDMQFALLFLLLLAGTQSVCTRFLKRDATPTALSVILFPLGVCSAWYWNRLDTGDIYVPYFFVSLILGVLVAWSLRGQIPRWVLAMYVIIVAASVWSDFRPRLLVAFAAAAMLAVAQLPTVDRLARPLAPLGRISYSLFLIHYLVNWVVLAALLPFIGQRPERALAALAIAFLASFGAAIALHIGVERPLLNWIKSLKPAR